MSVRTFDDVVEIVKPDPDSQYRLIPCNCGSSEVVYAKYIAPTGSPLWRTVCMDCGAKVDTGRSTRHDAQLEWNRRK